MARAIWNGVIAFGMVSIPVGISPASGEKDLSFNQIHAKCNSRIKLQKHCPVCDVVVPAEELVKGYEFAKGQYVIMQPEDFENLPVASQQRIEVKAFVDASEIDPVYFDKTYYLEPSEAGKKPYALLYQALISKNATAVGKVAIRQKEALCLLRASGAGVILETLHWPDEIREKPGFRPAEMEVNPLELQMAQGLIDLLYGKFEPEAFTDEYRTALLERITAKQTGGAIVTTQQPETEEKVFNLMDALKASLDAVKQQQGAS
jgi:DNA end-binding protein Ku